MNASPVTVLMSWCRLTTWTPVIPWTRACISGFAVSIRWVRTCLSKSLPFSDGQFGKLLLGGRQQALQTHDDEIADQVGVNLFGTPSPIFLFKSTDSIADGGLDLSLGFHHAGDSEMVAMICSNFPKSPGLTK